MDPWIFILFMGYNSIALITNQNLLSKLLLWLGFAHPILVIDTADLDFSILTSLELMSIFSKTNHHYSEMLVKLGFRIKKRLRFVHLCDLILTFLKAKSPAKSASSKWGMNFRFTMMQDAILAALIATERSH